MGIKETLIKFSEAPAEANVAITGNTVLRAENCICITACDENIVELRLKDLSLRIIGSGLVLENYGAYGVKLTGVIHSLTYEESGV
ncbi:MAG: YabP/YqfC family sporulation protein [Oscillospiraceae bacterium]